ncbi:MAG: hypothetical protein ACI4EI_04435 [Muricoprocola sp.]
MKKKAGNVVATVIYIIVLLALCACIVGLWMRQQERHESYNEMVQKAAQMETEYQLQRYESDETEEKLY